MAQRQQEGSECRNNYSVSDSIKRPAVTADIQLALFAQFLGGRSSIFLVGPVLVGMVFLQVRSNLRFLIKSIFPDSGYEKISL
jgi:hypothetical protein